LFDFREISIRFSWVALRWNGYIQPIASFLGTVDKVGLFADAVGCAVAMLTLDPVTAAFTSEVVDRTLRLPIVEEVVETGLSTVSQKCTLL
jgi:hypothetical protein